MTNQEVEQKLQDITDTITKQFDPEKLIPFGSRAWGKPREDSDFDVLVVKRNVASPLDAMREIRGSLIGKCRGSIDILVYTPEEIRRRKTGDLFVRQIMEEGRVLYEKHPRK